MRRILRVGATTSIAILFCLLAAVAHAADVPVAKTPGAAVKATRSWTGFHAGVHAGYGLNTLSADRLLADDNGDTILSVFPIDSNAIARGALYGGRVGFDYQLPNHFILGVVADVSRGGGQGRSAIPAINDVTLGYVATNKIGISWTLRGRLGYALDRTAIYATGGIASARNAMRADQDELEAATKNYTGWVAGVGIETLLPGDWRFGLEYRYLSLGTKTYCDNSNQQCLPLALRGQQGLMTLGYQF
jgi:outer membrane immunogenic protein